MEGTELVRTDHGQPLALAVPGLSVETVGARLKAIEQLMREHMKEGVDYGKSPGTDKPAIFKPGAEKISVMFQIAVRPDSKKTFQGEHLIVETEAVATSLDGHFLGSANAMCSTYESKYRYRRGQRACPACGVAGALRKSKYPDRVTGLIGWWCAECKANFGPDEPAITTQQTGRVANPDLADQYNTVIRMAEKRAYIAVVRLATGASALFDEENPGGDGGYPEREEVGEGAEQAARTSGTGKPASQGKEAGKGRQTGSTASRRANADVKPRVTITAEQVAEIEGWCAEFGYEVETIVQQYAQRNPDVKSLADLSVEQYEHCKRGFEKNRARQQSDLGLA